MPIQATPEINVWKIEQNCAHLTRMDPRIVLQHFSSRKLNFFKLFSSVACMGIKVTFHTKKCIQNWCPSRPDPNKCLKNWTKLIESNSNRSKRSVISLFQQKIEYVSSFSLLWLAWASRKHFKPQQNCYRNVMPIQATTK